MGAFPQQVRAAGGVVVDEDGRVCVVHRPRYDDWSLPKGKLDGDESHREAAVREVHEETGLRCEITGDELAAETYEDRRGRTKTVRWWPMRVVAADPVTPNDEVDEWRWVAPEEAAMLLDHAHDRALVRSLSR